MLFALFPSCLHYQTVRFYVLFDKFLDTGLKDLKQIAPTLWLGQSVVESTVEMVSAPSILAICDGVGSLSTSEVKACQLTKQQQLPVVRIHRPGRFRKGLLDD